MEGRQTGKRHAVRRCWFHYHSHGKEWRHRNLSEEQRHACVFSFRRLPYCDYSRLTKVITDLATWLRIPSNLIIIYDRNAIYRYHSQERWPSHISEYYTPLLIWPSEWLAKHLEPLKDGKVHVELLIRGKDAEQNAKHFKKCLDIIKNAGVGTPKSNLSMTHCWDSCRRKLGRLPKIIRLDPL